VTCASTFFDPVHCGAPTAKSLHKLTGTPFSPTAPSFPISFSSSTFSGGFPINTGNEIEADDLRNTDETLLDARLRVLVQDVDRDFLGFLGEGVDAGEKEDCGMGGEDIFLLVAFVGCGGEFGGAGAFGISRSGLSR